MTMAPATAPLLPGETERSRAIDAIHAATAIYTSGHVVDQVLDRIGWPQPGCRLLDPSAGDGAFLVQALGRLPLEVNDVVGAQVIEGWELHQGAVAEARTRIRVHLEGRGWIDRTAREAAQQIVRHADFLADQTPAGKFRLIAGNPPYLRFGHLPDYYKTLYSRVLRRHASGDLLHAFLDRCCEILPEDGMIALITADRWLINDRCAALRASIGERFTLAHLQRVDPATSFYRPKFRRAGQPPRIHPVEVLLSTKRDGLAITRAPIPLDGQPGASSAEHRPLGEVALVRLAPYLGPKGIFNIDAQTAARLPHADLVPIVDARSIEQSTDRLLPPTRFAIRTYSCHEPTGATREHILASRHKMPARGRRKEWWLPPELITLPLDAPALLIPRIARRLRAVPLPAGILPVDHGITVVSALPTLPLDALAEAICAPECQEWVASHAQRLEGDYLSITTKLLRKMPIPIRRLPHS